MRTQSFFNRKDAKVKQRTQKVFVTYGLTRRLILIMVLGVMVFSCQKSQKAFRFLNGEMINQTTISDMEHQYKIKYRQYEGFIAEYNDSLFNSFLLFNDNVNDYVGSDIISDKTINKLKTYKVEKIRFSYSLKKEGKDKDFENYIQNKYFQCKRRDINKNEFDLEYKGKIICKVNYYNIAIPNYSITLFPN